MVPCPCHPQGLASFKTNKAGTDRLPPQGWRDPSSPIVITPFKARVEISSNAGRTWLRLTFIEQGAPVRNEERFRLGFVQTDVQLTSIQIDRNGRCVVLLRSVRRQADR
jgi:hypothetical protein